MKPTLEKLDMAYPGVSDKFINEYLNRLVARELKGTGIRSNAARILYG